MQLLMDQDMSLSNRPDLGLSQIFSTDILAVRPHIIEEVDLDALHTNLPVDRRLSYFPHLLPSGEGLFIAPSFRDILQTEHFPDRINFEPAHSRGVGKQDSRNNVFFGDLRLVTFNPRTDIAVPVAVKPFLGFEGRRFLGQELAITRRLGAIGLSSVSPLGVLMSDSAAFMLSRFEEQIISLDSVNWQTMNQQEAAKLMRRGLVSLFELHVNNIFHGDAEPRNITIQPDLLKTWHVDLEHATIGSTDLDRLLGIKIDLYVFYRGLAKLQGKPLSFSDMVDNIIYPYEELVMMTTNRQPVARDIARILPILIKEYQRDFSGEPIGQYERAILLDQVADKSQH